MVTAVEVSRLVDEVVEEYLKDVGPCLFGSLDRGLHEVVGPVAGHVEVSDLFGGHHGDL